MLLGVEIRKHLYFCELNLRSLLAKLLLCVLYKFENLILLFLESGLFSQLSKIRLAHHGKSERYSTSCLDCGPQANTLPPAVHILKLRSIDTGYRSNIHGDEGHNVGYGVLVSDEEVSTIQASIKYTVESFYFFYEAMVGEKVFLLGVPQEAVESEPSLCLLGGDDAYKMASDMEGYTCDCTNPIHCSHSDCFFSSLKLSWKYAHSVSITVNDC